MADAQVRYGRLHCLNGDQDTQAKAMRAGATALQEPKPCTCLADLLASKSQRKFVTPRVGVTYRRYPTMYVLLTSSTRT